MTLQLENKAQRLTRAADILYAKGGFTPEGFKCAANDLHDAGINLTVADQQALMSLQGTTKFAVPDGSTVVGPTRSWLSNQIVRAYMPVADMSNHPLISMFPAQTVNGSFMQQNQFGSGFGMAQPANVIGGAQQQVSLLTRDGNIWTGYPIMAESSLDGTQANQMRAMFSDQLNENGAMELCNYQLQLLYDMTVNGIVGRTFDAIKKGSYRAVPKNDGTYINASINRGNSLIYTASESLATYNKTTNVFTENVAFAGNVFAQLTAALNNIKTSGYECEAIIMDNFIWSAMMTTPSTQSKLAYASFSSSNDIAGIQRNLFKTTMIPTLQNVPVLVYDQGYKFAPGKPSPATTRPLWWGEEVTSSSFRVFFKLRSPLGSPFGNTAFFADTIRDGLFSSTNSGTMIDLRMVDTTQYQPTNPNVKMWARTTWGLTYNDQAGFLAMFDPLVTVTS